MRKTLPSLLILLCGILLTHVSWAETDVVVRVGLLGRRELRVGGAEMTVTDARNGKVLAQGAGDWHVRHRYGTNSTPLIAVSEEGTAKTFKSSNEILFSPQNSDCFYLEGRRYRGVLLVRIKQDYASAVNLVPLEDYVRAVLPAEIGDDAPLEAMKAQCVAARTWTLFQLGKHRSQGYDFCTQNHCQAYLGTRVETTQTNRVVDETRGKVLVYPDENGDQVINALYSGCCGGVTRNTDGVWGGSPEPYFTEHQDWYADRSKLNLPLEGDRLRQWLTTSPPCFCNPEHGGKADEFRWQRRLGASTRRSIARRLGVGSTITGINVSRRASTGHVIEVRVLGDKSSARVSPQASVRATLGNLKSTLFVVEKQGSDIVLFGGGIGHGVGLCQDGAIGMANLGHDYSTILAHYYPGTRLVQAGNSHFNKPDYKP